MACRACDGLESKFDRDKAAQQLRRVRRRGPLPNTRRLIDQLRPRLHDGDALLDIGGGIGTIHHVLLDTGVQSATHLDASHAYLDVAREEASRLGHAPRVRFVHGDFVAIAGTVPAADVVTLDRVICCYPDMETMVAQAADKTRRVLGAVYPRDAWWVRVAVALENAMSRIRKSAFRVYLHAPATIEARLRERGLRRVAWQQTAFWEVATFERPS